MKRVIVAAPVKDDRALNVVVGVNDRLYEPERHRLLTAASCTTNCLAPVVKVVHEAIGIRHGQITTIHDPTNTNVVVDAPHKDLRRARSAMLSLQPTTTGSATAIALIYPELKGKLNGHAVRAPVLNASLTDCVFELKRPTTEAEVNELFAAAAQGPLAGILGFETRPLVSADYCNDTRSSIVDAPEHHGDRRHAAQGLRLVRQRDGLCLPHGRSRQHGDRRGGVMAPAARHYLIVTASYWGFTLVDGALRMLVLLHFFKLGYSPFTLAFLFLLYEFAGIVANLVGGWLATRFGIPRMLAVGPGAADRRAGHAVGARSGLDRGGVGRLGGGGAGHRRPRQGLHQDRVEDRRSRRRRPRASGQLFKWVACFTGSKNAMKGIGFFVGGLLLEVVGFKPALWLMAGADRRHLPGRPAAAAAPARQGQGVEDRARVLRQVARRQPAGRGAHLPVRRARGLVRRRPAGVPLRRGLALRRGRRLPRRLDDRLRRDPGGRACPGRAQPRWPQPRGAATRGCGPACWPPCRWRWRCCCATRACGAPTSSWSPGLALFALPFAVNSSLHSYLILAYAGSEKAAEDVGFYYAANATGRLIGILLSGALYQLGGMTACLFGSAAMLAVCWATTFLSAVPARHRAARRLDHR